MHKKIIQMFVHLFTNGSYTDDFMNNNTYPNLATTASRTCIYDFGKIPHSFLFFVLHP